MTTRTSNTRDGRMARASRPDGGDRDARSDRSVPVGVLVLAALSVAGGLVSVRADLSPDLLDAMGPQGRLSIPLPMLAAQLLLGVAAASRRRAIALAGSGLVAASLLLGVLSGFFDGGYADDRLGSGERATQVALIGTMVLVALLAVRRLVRLLRPR